MQGSADVINALNTTYRLLFATEEQAHLQENLFERDGWKSEDYWNDIENNIHKECTHSLIDRVMALGGSITPGPAFAAAVQAEFGDAITTTISALQQCRDSYIAVCNAAEAVDDYGTQKMSWCHIEWLESRIVRFEGLAVRFSKMGTVVQAGMA